MSAKLNLETLMDELESRQCASLPGTLEEWMNKNEFRKHCIRADGHCLLHAVIEVLKSNQITVTTEDLLDKLKSELRDHYQEYEPFSLDGGNGGSPFNAEAVRNLFEEELNAYIAENAYNSNIVDFMVPALCNAMGIMIVVMEYNDRVGLTRIITAAWRGETNSPNYVVHLHRSGSAGREHYDALVPSTSSVTCNEQASQTPTMTSFIYESEEIETFLKSFGIDEDTDIDKISEFIARLASSDDIVMTYKVIAYFTRIINAWKTTEVAIGVLGAVGAGKSSLVNAIRGVQPCDKINAAEESVAEGTLMPQKYTFPANKNICIWDLPGVNATHIASREEYLDVININKYDVFVIVSCTRFSRDDVWIAKQVAEIGKKCYFAHAKIQSDIDNDEKKYTQNFFASWFAWFTSKKSKQIRVVELLSNIRQGIEKNVKSLGFHTAKVYLIDNHAREKYDLAKLHMDIADSLPKWQRQALLHSLDNIGKAIIDSKIKVMNKDIFWTACSNALMFSGSPVFRHEQQAKAVLDKVKQYHRQLGLDEASLQKQARTLDAVNERNVLRALKNKYQECIRHQVNLTYYSDVLFNAKHSGMIPIDIRSYSIRASFKNVGIVLDESIKELKTAAEELAKYRNEYTATSKSE